LKNFKCPVCGGQTENIWESSTKTKIGLRCVDGHINQNNKFGERQYPVILVSSEDLV
jgi:hypothetical protein